MALIIIGAAGMAGSGAWPKVFYPMMWIGPLALWFGIAQLTGLASPAREIARGDWSRVATWMVAALGCGFFWEMWNWHSAAKWVYTVPEVERWFVFEMPLPGYAGYLPFGLECLLVAEGVIGVGGASRGWVGSADKSLE